MDSVTIFNKELEYNFLSGWIKYLRLNQGISQEALAHSICSSSHLCYFEKGEKKLRNEIIEALLIKLGISNIDSAIEVGSIRQKFSRLYTEIETLNHEAAEDMWENISSLEPLLIHSPYILEYKAYEILYKVFLHLHDDKEYLKEAISSFDKLILCDDIKYIFLLASGRYCFKFMEHSEGINRLIEASKLKNTPWVNYQLGFCYCFNDEHLTATYHLDFALKTYIMNGYYLNIIWCHNYLGMCYSFLKACTKAESHFIAAINGCKYFNVDIMIQELYINLTDCFMKQNKMKEALTWAEKALSVENCDPILAALNYAEILHALGDLESCIDVFKKYLIEDYKDSRYYKLLYLDYLYFFHLEEKIFYDETVNSILPFYADINYPHFLRHIKLKLIEHLEKNRRYKEANKIYKELLPY